MSTIPQLIADSEQIRDETIPGANSANRVGTLFKNISEEFNLIKIEENSKVFSFNNLIIGRADNKTICGLDFSVFPSGERAYGLMIEIFVFGTVNSQPANNGTSVNIVRENYLITSDRDGTAFVDSNIAFVKPLPASQLPLINDLVEIIVDIDFTDISYPKWVLYATINGSSSVNARYTGYVRATTNTIRPLPDFTNLL